MSEYKHTPGPWVAIKDSVMMYQIGIFPKDSIIPIGVVYGSLDNVENGANATLVAAAPDLLEALIACDEAMAYMSEYDIPLTLPDRVKAAIAKAKGEQ